MERVCFLSNSIAKANAVVCAGCQAGKSHIKAVSKTSNIVKKKIEEPGDLVHMDQTQSATPGRPLTYSGKNNKKKILCNHICR